MIDQGRISNFLLVVQNIIDYHCWPSKNHNLGLTRFYLDFRDFFGFYSGSVINLQKNIFHLLVTKNRWPSLKITFSTWLYFYFCYFSIFNKVLSKSCGKEGCCFVLIEDVLVFQVIMFTATRFCFEIEKGKKKIRVL